MGSVPLSVNERIKAGLTEKRRSFNEHGKLIHHQRQPASRPLRPRGVEPRGANAVVARITVVPEPATIFLLAGGSLILLRRRRHTDQK